MSPVDTLKQCFLKINYNIIDLYADIPNGLKSCTSMDPSPLPREIHSPRITITSFYHHEHVFVGSFSLSDNVSKPMLIKYYRNFQDTDELCPPVLLSTMFNWYVAAVDANVGSFCAKVGTSCCSSPDSASSEMNPAHICMFCDHRRNLFRYFIW
jgi:hypothetical protein